MIPENGLDDFHLSCLLLSRTLHVDYAQSHKLLTDYSKVHIGDEAHQVSSNHCFVLD